MAFRFNQGDRPLAGYTILRGVGRGGFGEVYYATSDGGKEVALKYLRENPAIELRGVQHCLNLKSPYLVALHDIKQNTDGDFFVIMEYVNGSSLRELMNDAPQGLGPQKAAYLIREIGRGLAYLHDRGIVHRDLKPGNIFYEDGYVKICDYGLAKLMAASQHSGQTVSVGTVHYMAPEVGSGNYDRTIDIYAMGVILYEMVLGRVPFAGATMGEVLMKHLTAQPAVDELPAPFPDVIRKALAKDPKERYQNVGEMMADLFAVEAIDQSVASFEPASLSVAAKRVAKDIHATLSASPRPPVGMVGMGSSNVGPPPVINRVPPLPPLPQGRFGRLHQKINNRAETLAARIDQTGLARQVSEATGGTGRTIERLIIAVVIAAGLSFGISFLQEDRHPFFLSVIVFLNVACIVQAVLIGNWLSYERNKIDGVFVPRLITAALAWITMVGVAKMGHGIDGVESLAKGVILVMLCCDWGKRYYEGRQGRVSTGMAIGAGISGLIFGIIFGHGHGGLTLGTICAAASLALQAISGLHPLRPGEVIPRTSGDEPEQPEKPSDKGLTPMHPAVAVELADSADRRAAFTPPKTSRMPSEPPIVMPTGESPSDSLVPRSRAIRSLWLLVSGIILCTGILFFAAPQLGARLSADESNGFIIAGIAAMYLFVFSFTRTFRRYHIGLWRGVLRPFIFLAGIGLAACSGAAWGMFNLHGEEAVGALAAILSGSMLGLFVWFVPIGPYSPRGSRTQMPAFERWGLNGAILKKIGILGYLLTGGILAILGATLSRGDMDDVAPAVAVPLGLLSTFFLVSGVIKQRRHKKALQEQTYLSLPLRRSFELDRPSFSNSPNANYLEQLFNLMDTHLMLLGYRPLQHSDQLRSYTRGRRFMHLLQQDVRRWHTQLNIAVYDQGDRYRVNCYLDVEADFREPGQRKLAILNEELGDLQQALAGRQIPSNSPLQVHAEA
jgi:serine/threonine protein kinase